jgi:succinate dehydrogenase/fumarate reductase flavoprotein subunit
MLRHDVLVVGAGGAGLRAALAAARLGVDVAILSKVHPLRSHTGAAEGGINAAFAEQDSWENHAYDTVRESDWLADQDAAEVLAQEGPAAVYELDHLGALFSRGPDGRFLLRPFGPERIPRTVFAGDTTGHAVLQTLYQQALKERLRIYEEWLVLDLVIEDGVCAGVLAYEIPSGTVQAVAAGAVILATGGAGRLYANTTNAYICTGDGMAIALRNGVPLKDMEMVQFHPTTLPGSGILITEGARAEGGYLLNARGERFMARYAPRLMEQAGRDVVCRAEQTEIDEGRGVDGCVLLDLRHLGEERIKSRLAQTRELCITYAGVDPVHEPIPVRPGAHYFMGGIHTELTGQTTIPGLYAVGECACVSVHGANRLGGNSLLELLVFGRRAGESAAEFARNQKDVEVSEARVRDTERELARIVSRSDGERWATLRDILADTMSREMGIFRTGDVMRHCLSVIRELKERYRRVRLDDRGRVYNYDLVSTIELGFMLDVAEAVVVSGLGRQESRGAHYRRDYSARDDANWLKHTVVHRDPEGNLHLDYLPVRITRWLPAARVY